MTISVDISQIGHSLSKHSRGAEFTAQRGLVGELFPFLVDASARMSSRAISRFLQEQHSVKLSYATITKALNDPEKYWRLYFDTFLPAAYYIEKKTRVPCSEFLLNPQKSQERHIKLLTRQLKNAKLVESDETLTRCRAAVAVNWYMLNPDQHAAGLPHLKKYLEELKLSGSKNKGKV